MQTFTGRITENAKVNSVNADRQVVNFSIAVNEHYRTKSGEVKEQTTFIKCGYWFNTGVAQHLTKGMLVEVTGRIGLNVWNNSDGNAVGQLTLNVNQIKFHGKAKDASTPKAEPSVSEEQVNDNLPF